MKMFVIEDTKKKKIAKGLEDMLHIGGMLMQCMENLDEDELNERDEWDDDYGYGHRSRMPMSRYGGDMSERRGRRY